MNVEFKEKADTKEEKKKIIVPDVKEKEEKKEFVHLLDEDQVEVKKLAADDIEDAVKVMRKCSFEVTENEVGKIIEYGMSFGCYVNRMLVGVGLGWPANFDPEKKIITSRNYNAIYLEDPAVLLMYEGRGIRRILLKEREKAASSKNFSYAIAYLYEDLPKGSIVEYIKEAGSQLEKLYLSEGYEFFKTERGVLAVKRL